MIAVLGWVDGFGADTKVEGIFRTMADAINYVGDLKKNADRDCPLRYQKFDLGEVDFDYYEADHFPTTKNFCKRK